MGLDMYLYQLKKIDNEDNVKDVVNANIYYFLKNNHQIENNKQGFKELKRFLKIAGIQCKDLNYGIIKKYKKVLEKNNPLDDEIVYWRKANAIHSYLIENSLESDEVGSYDDYNCKYLTILSETLIDLRDRCQLILDKSEIVDGDIEASRIFKDGEVIPVYVEGEIIKDSDIAEELLPTRGGFFHGSIDYDEYYIDSLKYTIQELNELFEQDGCDNYIYLYYPYW